ncbi:hypothetical protein [Pseudomonas sp. Sample_24]|uniref:hypothetical protein n=1 Tax=Pseudomonas sp. Sample_24 TaxID=2448268 RepID=UPI001032CB49|nr:hypothetical protein [Pseudomonas sp. Sample_24]
MRKFLVIPFMLLTPLTFAATSTEMGVDGKITPAACDIAIADANFDFGSSIALNPTGETLLPVSTGHPMSIACTGPAYVGFRGIDNRSGTSTGGNIRYGLGTDGAGNKIGWYRIIMLNPSANGGTGYVKYSANLTTWTTLAGTNAGDLNTFTGSNTTYAVNPTNNGTAPPQAITSASLDLTVTPTIAPRNTLDTNNAINLDGSATIELVYL